MLFVSLKLKKQKKKKKKNKKKKKKILCDKGFWIFFQVRVIYSQNGFKEVKF